MPGDPAASEQMTRSMRSSVVMRGTWRASYTVGGVPGVTDWTPTGETLQAPAGAVVTGYEYGGEIIDGGPWYVQGGGPKT